MQPFAILPDQQIHAAAKSSIPGKIGKVIGIVDHIEGNFIKLRRDASLDDGYHWIPLDWVSRVESEHIYLSKTEREVRDQCSHESPTEFHATSRGE